MPHTLRFDGRQGASTAYVEFEIDGYQFDDKKAAGGWDANWLKGNFRFTLDGKKQNDLPFYFQTSEVIEFRDKLKALHGQTDMSIGFIEHGLSITCTVGKESLAWKISFDELGYPNIEITTDHATINRLFEELGSMIKSFPPR